FSAIEIFGTAKDAAQKSRDFQATIQKCLKQAFQNQGPGLWRSHKELLAALLGHGVAFRCQGSMVRKSFLLEHDLFFDTAMDYTQDSHFMTLAAYFTPFLYIEKV